ncbi:uncharacterized protein LOC119660818 isoform X2 [Hermetia illucens]|uniref:uncharacterized protein LOC119660818 isoform X2 n=1 Tax=Hermetia illucens TaxID=343691 RepID=UPI0018CC064F|nr:uncharacterized protein LOC119660818 isoform X2 [Hermetia illucens]
MEENMEKKKEGMQPKKKSGKDSDTEPQLLSIGAFNNRGEISDPIIPCTAACIDPAYIIDTNIRRRLRRFLVKTDVLKLRDITRTKFFLYTNQELALEEQDIALYNQRVYEGILEVCKFASRKLSEVESSAFDDMQYKYNDLAGIRANKKLDQFRYLLKLIEYFDHVSDTCDDISTRGMTTLLDSTPMKHGSYETKTLEAAMDQFIRPCLLQKTYMDPSVWERSYQTIRRKIANYNQDLTKIALSSHYTGIVHDAFIKSNVKGLTRKGFYKDIQLINDRSHFLKGATEELIESFERNERKDSLNVALEGIVPVMVHKLELDTKPMDISHPADQSTIDKLERIQKHLIHLLYQVDSHEPTLCYQVEKTVREQICTQQTQSKEALLLQTRFNNLLEHYRSHYRKKNINRANIIRSSRNLFKLIRRSPKIAPQHTASAAMPRKVSSS